MEGVGPNQQRQHDPGPGSAVMVTLFVVLTAGACFYPESSNEDSTYERIRGIGQTPVIGVLAHPMMALYYLYNGLDSAQRSAREKLALCGSVTAHFAGMFFSYLYQGMLAGVTKVLHLCFMGFGKLNGLFQVCWRALSNGGRFLWTQVTTASQFLWGGLCAAVLAVWEPTIAVLKFVWRQITFVSTKVWNGICSVVGAIWKATTFASSKLWNGVCTVMSAIWKATTTALSFVWRHVTFASSKLWNGVCTVMSAIWKATTTAISFVWRHVTFASSKLWNGVCTVMSAIWKATTAILNSIWSKLSSGSRIVWGAFLQMCNHVTRAASAVWKALATLCAFIWKGVAAVANSAWRVVRTVLDALRRVSLKAWGGLVAVVRFTWKHVTAVVGFFWNGLRTVAGYVWGAITSVFDTLWKHLSTMCAFLWTGLKTVARSGWRALTSVFRALWSVCSKVWEVLSSVCRFIAGKVAFAARTAWTGVAKVLAAISKALTKGAKKLWDGTVFVCQGITSAFYALALFFGACYKGVLKAIRSAMFVKVTTLGASAMFPPLPTWTGMLAYNFIARVASMRFVGMLAYPLFAGFAVGFGVQQYVVYSPGLRDIGFSMRSRAAKLSRKVKLQNYKAQLQMKNMRLYMKNHHFVMVANQTLGIRVPVWAPKPEQIPIHVFDGSVALQQLRDKETWIPKARALEVLDFAQARGVVMRSEETGIKYIHPKYRLFADQNYIKVRFKDEVEVTSPRSATVSDIEECLVVTEAPNGDQIFLYGLVPVSSLATCLEQVPVDLIADLRKHIRLAKFGTNSTVATAEAEITRMFVMCFHNAGLYQFDVDQPKQLSVQQVLDLPFAQVVVDFEEFLHLGGVGGQDADGADAPMAEPVDVGEIARAVEGGDYALHQADLEDHRDEEETKGKHLAVQ